MAISPPQNTNLKTITVLDVPIHQIDMATAIVQIDGFIQSGKPHHIVTADASMLVIAHEDAELKRIVQSADLVTPDGAGLIWASKRLKQPLSERVSGVALVEKLCSLSPEKGYRLFFFGAAPQVAEQAAERMNSKYPGALVVGARDGFFQPQDIPAIIEQIKSARPDVLCIALGIPKQEKFIAQYKATLGVPVLIGVGGTFDVLSGNLKRAPVWMQRLSLEWLWRLLQNPSKINKVKLLPRFVQLVRKHHKYSNS